MLSRHLETHGVMGTMTRLVAALQALGLEGKIALAGHRVELAGDRYTVYGAETTSGRGYYTWGQAPDARVVEFYLAPVEAIESGVRRTPGTSVTKRRRNPGQGERSWLLPKTCCARMSRRWSTVQRNLQ